MFSCDLSGDYSSLGFHHAVDMLIIGKSCYVRIPFATHKFEYRIYYACNNTTIVKVSFNPMVLSLRTFLVFWFFYSSFNVWAWIIPALNYDDDDYERPTLQALSLITQINLNALENGYLDNKYITSVEIKVKKLLSHKLRCLPGRATTILAQPN